MKHQVYSKIMEAVKDRRLHEPFSAGEFRNACPGLAEGTYSTFLSKHTIGNPGGNSQLFERVSLGKYRCIRPFLYGFSP